MLFERRSFVVCTFNSNFFLRPGHWHHLSQDSFAVHGKCISTSGDGKYCISKKLNVIRQMCKYMNFHLYFDDYYNLLKMSHMFVKFLFRKFCKFLINWYCLIKWEIFFPFGAQPHVQETVASIRRVSFHWITWLCSHPYLVFDRIFCFLFQ